MSADNERSADILDQATATTEMFTKADVANARAKLAPETHPDFDGEHCVEAACGVELAPVRLEMQRVRCVECQNALEDRARRRL